MKYAVILGLAVAAPLLLPPAVPAQRLGPNCPNGQVQPVRLVSLERYDEGAWNLPCFFMVKNAADWDRLMLDMLGRGELAVTPPQPAPSIDWKHYNVVVVSLGQLPSDGFGVEVKSVNREMATALLDLEVRLPVGTLIPQVITYPYHMIQVEKPGLKNVVICSQTFIFDRAPGAAPSSSGPRGAGAAPSSSDPESGGTARPSIASEDPAAAPPTFELEEFQNLSPPDPLPGYETWGGVKARFR